MTVPKAQGTGTQGTGTRGAWTRGAWWHGPHLPAEAELRTSLRNVVVTPTRFGVAFAGLLLALLLGCVNYGLSFGYLVVFWLGAVWLLGAVEAATRASGLRVRFAPPPQGAFAGSEAAFRVALQGPAGRARRAVEVGAGRRVAFVDLDGGGAATLTLTLPAPRRGRQPLGRVRVQAHDTLALWRARRPARSAVHALVYPAPEVGAPPPPAGAHAGEGGTAPAQPGGDEAGGLREYRPGDPLRRVSWRHAARGGPLRVRELEGDASATRLSLAAAGTGDLEARLSRLTAWALALHAQGAVYGLALPEREVPPARGDAQLHAVLSALAEHAPGERA